MKHGTVTALIICTLRSRQFDVSGTAAMLFCSSNKVNSVFLFVLGAVIVNTF